MGTESTQHDSVAVASSCDVNIDHEGVDSSNGDAFGDLGIVSSSMLTRLDLSLARFSEKVTNLRIFVMRLATMESEFEDLILEKDHLGSDSFEKVLEFEMSCGVLDSEISELERYLATLQAAVADAREGVSSCNHFGETFIAMQDKLLDSEQYLKQSEVQFAEIKVQSTTFRRTLSSFKKAENGNAEADEIVKGDSKSLSANAEIKMQTVERNFSNSREIQEELKLRAISLEQELVHMEEEATDVWQRWFEADNASEILLGISKGLLGRLQVSQLNLNSLSHSECELRANLGTLKDAEDKLILANSEGFTLSEKVSSLEKQLEETKIQLNNVKASADEYQQQYVVMCSEERDMENLVVELKEKISNAESRAIDAEAKCKLLTENNSKLNEELALLKDDGGKSAKVDLLERQLKESDLQLQNAVACAEASQEKQSMLYSTIRDMENVIKDLKSKISKAETRADSAEENCIILSESNAELNGELSFLRSRLECLEGSLHREEEAKMATAKDIGKQTKVLNNLLTQLAVERERLKQQLSSLASENKILVVKLKQTYKDSS